MTSKALENWQVVEKWVRDNAGPIFSHGMGPETMEAILAVGRDFIAEAEAIAVDAPVEVALLFACRSYVDAGGKREGVTFSAKKVTSRRFGVIEGGKREGEE